jgi:hypothetical protein
MAEIVKSNIVVVAENLNPSIFREMWLVKEGVFAENEIKSGSLYSSVSVNVQTPDSDLLIIPERLQLTLKTDERQDEVIKKVLVTVVEALPHTPYKAIGFNFHWILETSGQREISEVSQDMFLSEKNPLRNIFATDDARVGVYLSKDELGMRLKLEVRPVKGVVENAGKEALRLNFNFDKLINSQENATGIVLETIDKWLAAKTISENIVKEVSENAAFI